MVVSFGNIRQEVASAVLYALAVIPSKGGRLTMAFYKLGFLCGFKTFLFLTLLNEESPHTLQYPALDRIN